MKDQIRNTMASVLMALALPAGLAAGNVGGVVSESFEVPFDFVLGDAQMPAGQYEIQNDPDWLVLWVCADGVRCSVVQSARNRQLRRADGQLVFVEENGGPRLVYVQLRPGTGYRLPNCPRMDPHDGETKELVTVAAQVR